MKKSSSTKLQQMSVMFSSYLLTYKIRKIHSMEGHKKDFFSLMIAILKRINNLEDFILHVIFNL